MNVYSKIKHKMLFLFSDVDSKFINKIEANLAILCAINKLSVKGKLKILYLPIVILKFWYLIFL